MMKAEDRHHFMDLSEDKILALCIYFEARGEPLAGKIGVGSVVLNRADRNGMYGSGIHGVITRPAQFSWLNSAPPQAAQDPQYDEAVRIAATFDGECTRNEALRQCARLAWQLLSGEIKRNTEALHYMTGALYRSKKCPRWAKSMAVEKVIGNHVFLV